MECAVVKGKVNPIRHSPTHDEEPKSYFTVKAEETEKGPESMARSRSSGKTEPHCEYFSSSCFGVKTEVENIVKQEVLLLHEADKTGLEEETEVEGLVVVGDEREMCAELMLGEDHISQVGEMQIQIWDVRSLSSEQEALLSVADFGAMNTSAQLLLAADPAKEMQSKDSEENLLEEKRSSGGMKSRLRKRLKKSYRDGGQNDFCPTGKDPQLSRYYKRVSLYEKMGTLEFFRKKESHRVGVYNASLTKEKLERRRECSRLRQRRFRERQKEKEQVCETEEEVQQRKVQRERMLTGAAMRMRRKRSRLTEDEKKAINAERRRKYREKKKANSKHSM